jgi:hypothetical protein
VRLVAQVHHDCPLRGSFWPGNQTHSILPPCPRGVTPANYTAGSTPLVSCLQRTCSRAYLQLSAQQGRPSCVLYFPLGFRSANYTAVSSLRCAASAEFVTTTLLLQHLPILLAFAQTIRHYLSLPQVPHFIHTTHRQVLLSSRMLPTTT